MGFDATMLAGEWRRLRRAATAVAIFTAPLFFVVLYDKLGMSFLAALAATIGTVIAFRGLVDVVVRKFLPWPSLYGVERDIAEEDVVARRRTWFWRSIYRFVFLVGVLLAVIGGIVAIFGHKSWWDGVTSIFTFLGNVGSQLPKLAFSLFILFLGNMLILFGPLLAANLRQVRGYEPGDASWGVQMEDVRGQAEPKEEVARVVRLWQSGEEFEKAGGKRERGLLFLGAPGTGKTMLAKAIATNFNCPFVTIPGSGFAATFIGIDVIVVMFLIRKAKRWPASGAASASCSSTRSTQSACAAQSLGAGGAGSASDHLAPRASRTTLLRPVGIADAHRRSDPRDAGVARAAVRRARRARTARTSRRSSPSPPSGPERYMFPGMMGGMGGGLGAQPAARADGRDRRGAVHAPAVTKRLNTLLDAVYFVPRRIGNALAAAASAPKPADEQVFFIGATNVPIDRSTPR